MIINDPASPEGIQAQKDIDYGIYNVLDNIYVERGIAFGDNEFPALNIIFNRADFPAGNIQYQTSDTSINIAIHVAEPHSRKESETTVSSGDQRSIYVAGRIAYLIRAIIMSGFYITLGLPAGSIDRRWINSIDLFNLDEREKDALHGLTGIVNVSVKHPEYPPEDEGVQITAALANIFARVRTDDITGKLIVSENTL